MYSYASHAHIVQYNVLYVRYVFVLHLGIVSFNIYLSDSANSVIGSAAVQLKRKTKELN
jgi:hypothetical protein